MLPEIDQGTEIHEDHSVPMTREELCAMVEYARGVEEEAAAAGEGHPKDRLNEKVL
jgi:hypothetical protein